MVRAARAPGRLAALDGLRGIAAVVVVAWHAMVSTGLARFAPLNLGPGDAHAGAARAPGSLEWFLLDTPLRLFTMGTNAVIVFFVLSGFVLTLPLYRGRALDLWAYYPRRVIRLWVPSAVSVVLAMAVIVLTRQDPADAESRWGALFSFPSLKLGQAASSFFLITGSDAYNNPLWSLRWEMLFSLFLPVAFLIGLRVSGVRALWAAIAVSALLSGAGAALGVDALKYGPMFLVGVFVARLFHERAAQPRAGVSWLLVLGGLVLVGAPDAARSYAGLDPFGRVSGLLDAAVVLGAAFVVFGLTIPSGISSAFASAPFRWLGRISFGLYLVHAPLILAGVHVFGSATWALLCTVPLSFAVAWLFTRYVEEPSARLARSVGERCSAAIAGLSASAR